MTQLRKSDSQASDYRPHLLGWGEAAPVVDWSLFLAPVPRCRICGAGPREPHEVIVMGERETWERVLSA